jgi:ribulose-5-phosphate 4-epimerase/fuculose-1-phosphate aldolase
MNIEEARKNLLDAHRYFETQNEGYKSWGRVKVLQIAQRVSATEFLLTDEKKSLEDITENDVKIVSSSSSIFQQLFLKRKKVQIIFITQQEFASQVQEEIPAILDDQAQLLGVSIRVAKSESEILYALKGRYAAVLSQGKSICIGTSIEDGYVAAQLLEKTAKVFVEAKHIGGAKPINKIEAWFMQQYYLFKYSKEAEKNK